MAVPTIWQKVDQMLPDLWWSQGLTGTRWCSTAEECKSILPERERGNKLFTLRHLKTSIIFKVANLKKTKEPPFPYFPILIILIPSSADTPGKHPPHVGLYGLLCH